MALPNVGGGYQFNDGNVNEILLDTQGAPATATTTATLAAADITNGLIVASPGTSAASYTLPTATLLEAVVNNAKVDSAFEFGIVNLGTSSGALTIVAGTGWTLVGSATVAITSSARFIARKTATGAWTLYRVS